MKLILAILLVSPLALARTEYSSIEYKKTSQIISDRGNDISQIDVDKVLTYALMETNSVWETNIFGQIRHALKSSNLKYSVSKYLIQQMSDIFFHPNDLFSYKGQKFSITENTRHLALMSFWDLAEAKLEVKDVLDSIQKRMFDLSKMALSENAIEQKHVKNYLQQTYEYIQKQRGNQHVDLFALGIKNQIFNIYAGSDNTEVRTAAYNIISAVIKNSSKTNPVKNEYNIILTDLSQSFSFQACKKMWN